MPTITIPESEITITSTDIQVSAGILFYRDNSSGDPFNRICIGRRSTKGNHYGYWELPGGKIEKGETAKAALIREIEEELGLSITVRSLFESITIRELPQKLIVHFFLCECKEPTFQSTSHDALLWVHKEELVEILSNPTLYPIAEADIPVLKKLLITDFDIEHKTFV